MITIVIKIEVSVRVYNDLIHVFHIYTIQSQALTLFFAHAIRSSGKINRDVQGAGSTGNR